MTEKICQVAGCDYEVLARGLCSKHYTRVYRSGELSILRPNRGVETFKRPPIDPVDLAYFAGYFDGEGCVYLQRPPKSERHKPLARWPLRVELNQTQEHTVLEIHRVYGGSLTLDRLEYADGSTSSRYSPKHRPFIKWMLAQTEAVVCFLRDIQSFLREKKAQVDLSLERFRTYLSPEEGQALYEELRNLKRRSLCPQAIARHVEQFGSGQKRTIEKQYLLQSENLQPEKKVQFGPFT